MILILTISLIFSSISAATGQVPSPENVRIISQNLGLVLEWDPPQNVSERNLTYTAQYNGWQSYVTICVNDSQSCDFTNELSIFGTYHFRVRTELEGQSSEWVETSTISLEEITLISPPDVKLQSKKGEIEVDITDPVLRKSNLRYFFSDVGYLIHYWTEGQKKEVLRVDHTSAMLMSLTPKVWYCVQVGIIFRSNKTSLLSNETCILNTENDDVKPWLIVVVLVSSFVVVFVLVVLIFYAVLYTYRGIKFLCPNPKLPEHLKQYLSEHPKSSLFLQNGSQVEERYHEVIIIPCPEDPFMSQEVHQMESSSCTQPFTNTSSKPEEELTQEEKSHKNEHIMDCNSTERDVAPSDDGETELLLK